MICSKGNGKIDFKGSSDLNNFRYDMKSKFKLKFSHKKEFCTMMSRKGNSMDNEEGLMEAFQRFDKVSLIL